MIHLPKHETKNMVAIHGWSGIILGLLLYAVVLTGMAAVFAHEIETWSAGATSPHSPFARPIDAALRDAAARTPERFYDDLVLFPDARNSLVAFFHRQEPNPDGGLAIERGVRYDFDRNGRIISSRSGTDEEIFGPANDDALGHFLIDTHVRLHVPDPWGLLLTGILGLAMLVAAISGLLIHRHLFKDIFTLRRDARPVLAFRDRHSVAATWSLPFAFLLAFTGSYFSFAATVGIPAVAQIAFAGDQNKMVEILVGAPAMVNTRRQAPGDLNHIIADSTKRAGSPPAFVQISHWGRADMSVSTGHDPAEGALTGSQYLYDGMSARFLNEKPALGTKPSAGATLAGMMGPIHFGSFAGILSKAIWLGLGFAMCYVTLTGMQLWLRRREDDNPALVWLDRLVILMGFGLPMALIGSAIGYFLSAPQGHAVWWVPASFLMTSAVAIFIGLIVTDRKRYSTILRLSSGLGLIVAPVLRLATGGPSWGEAVASGQPIIMTVDIGFILAGAAYFWFLRKEKMPMQDRNAPVMLQAVE